VTNLGAERRGWDPKPPVVIPPRWHGWILPSILTVVGLVVVYFVGSFFVDSWRDVRDRNGPLPLYSVQVGDCLKDLDGWEDNEGLLMTLPVAPCTESHVSEVYVSFKLPDSATQPDQDEIERTCSRHFDDYVGVPPEESQLGLSWIFPDDEGWQYGDRTVLCMVDSLGGEITGSVADSRR